MNKPFFLLASAVLCGALHAQHAEIRIWEGKAPGSENWAQTESRSQNGSSITNVSEPAFTVYAADPAIANGAAVIVCPGGGFRMLSWDEEGVKAAQWLNRKGITAFILKYRIVQSAPASGTAGPAGGVRPGQAGMPQMREIEIRNGNANPDPNNQELKAVIGMAIADAQQAMRIVRRRAKEWSVDPQRVGIMGFSAGGGVAVGTAIRDKSDGYPDFVISAYGPSLEDVTVPQHGAPLFIAVGVGHPNVANGCAALFSLWKAAKRSVEFHAFDNVNGPFGMTKRGQTVDAWTDLLYSWLRARGIVGADTNR